MVIFAWNWGKCPQLGFIETSNRMYNLLMKIFFAQSIGLIFATYRPQIQFFLRLSFVYLVMNTALVFSAHAEYCEGILVNIPGQPPSCEYDSDGDDVWDSRDKCPGSPATPVDREGCHETQRGVAVSANGDSAPSGDSSVDSDEKFSPESDVNLQSQTRGKLRSTENLDQLSDKQNPTEVADSIDHCLNSDVDQNGLAIKCTKRESLSDHATATSSNHSLKQNLVSDSAVLHKSVAATVNIEAVDLDQDKDGVADELDVCAGTAAGQLVDEKGCPKGDKVILEGALFSFNSPRLSSKAKMELESLVAIIKQQPELRLNIFGFTDSTGDENFNLHLSQRRADSVAQFFIAGGVSPSQIIRIQGLGSAYPRVPNLTAAQRAMNRRVEIEFFPSNFLPPQSATTSQLAPAVETSPGDTLGEKELKACDPSGSNACGQSTEVWVLPLDSFTTEGELSSLARAELQLLATALTKELRSIQSIQLAVRKQGITQTVNLTESQKNKVKAALTLAGVAAARLPKEFGQPVLVKDIEFTTAVEGTSEVMDSSLNTERQEPDAPINEDVADKDNDGVTDDQDLCARTLEGALVGTDGCLIKQTYLVAVQLFLPRSSTLIPEGEQFLMEIADSLKHEVKARVEIAAFTDNRGSFDFNLEVSQNRANMVADFLRANGVASRMIFSTKGYGSMNPIASNFDEAGRRANERIELNFIR